MSPEGWRIVVTRLKGWDSRVEVFDPHNKVMARCSIMPTPAAAFGWGQRMLDDLTRNPEATP